VSNRPERPFEASASNTRIGRSLRCNDPFENFPEVTDRPLNSPIQSSTPPSDDAADRGNTSISAGCRSPDDAAGQADPTGRNPTTAPDIRIVR
jgi:hypothetical protein